MVRFKSWRTLTVVAFVAAAAPARAAEAYQVATISSLLAGGYEAARLLAASGASPNSVSVTA